MIHALFGFRGRLGQLGFLGWNLAGMALVAAITVAFLALGVGLSIILPPGGRGPTILGILTALCAGGAGIWMTLALAAKRLRDIGLAPLPIMIGMTVLLAIDFYLVTRFTGVRFFAPFAQYTPLGGLLATGWVVFLVCWPGSSEPDSSDATDPLMRGTAIAVTAAIAVVSCALLAPLNYFVPQRHALAQRMLDTGWPSVTAALLTPLAERSDSRALNNLGVLRARGVGTYSNFDEARWLFSRAADSGSVRARLNDVMIRNGRCGLNIPKAANAAAGLARIGASDPAAASLIQDCLYFAATSETLPDRDQRSVAAGTEIQKTNDGDVLLHSGWALLNRARTAQRPLSGDAGDAERGYDAIALPLARKAMELLFAAADAGAAGAYEPLGILSMQFGEKLGNDPLAVRLRNRDNWEWLEAGAEKGDWAATCRVAQARITQLRFDGKPYTRQAFDAAVAMARGCIDRQEAQLQPQWSRPPEWLVVTPRVTRQPRPTLDIEATAAALNGFMFFDADRKLSQNAAAGTAGRKP